MALIPKTRQNNYLKQILFIDLFSITLRILIILSIPLLGRAAIPSLSSMENENSLIVKSNFGYVICPNGVSLKIPHGTKLLITEQRFGNQPIVKVPKGISKKCNYGILKYKTNSQSHLESFMRLSKSKNIKKFSQIAEEMNYSDRCMDEFIGSEGLGDWGRYVKKELSSKSFVPLLKNTKTFKNICPGYASMKSDERKNLWVFVLMSMSHYESSCRPQVEAQGPNGIAKGLFQLHENFENRYSHWDIAKICKKGGAKNPKESLRCTLSMLSGQVEKFNALFFEKSYWDVLRNSNEPETHASKIKTAISMLNGCGLRNVATSN